jgi:hypothetical protein
MSFEYHEDTDRFLIPLLATDTLHPSNVETVTSRRSKSTISRKLKQPKLSTPVPCRLSKPLKANYMRWLNWKYYGEKLAYPKFNERIGEYEQKVGPLPANTRKSLNFWLCKSRLSGQDKRATVCDLLGMYGRDQIGYDELLFFCNPISQKKIMAHNRNEATYYYCNCPFAKVSNLMLDWDDKDQLFGDTSAAAAWLNEALLLQQGFIEPSTSGTGTHQYVYVFTDGVSVPEQKALYRELIRLLRLEVKDAGFRCWEAFDEIKGIAPEISWHQSNSKRHQQKPHFYQIEVCGILAKFPRLASTEDEARWTDRKVITWAYLSDLVHRLQEKHRSDKEDEREWIGSSVTGTVSLEEADGILPLEVQRQVVTMRLNDMLASGGKQRAALASVFVFEKEYGRRPHETDFSALNDIYNSSATATDLLLTPDRRKRFQKALSYSAGRSIKTSCLIAPDAIQAASDAFGGTGLDAVNKKLRKWKQRPLTPSELGRVWCYFLNNYNSKLNTSDKGRVSWNSLKGLADSDIVYKTKLSRNSITECLKLFITLKLIRVVEEHDRLTRDCAKYELLRLP